MGTHLRLLLTLLFLGAVGLHRTWDLRGYTADGLALLTGRKRAYGYRYTEAFLSQVASASGAELLTDALATWTAQLWQTPEEASEPSKSLTCYIDGHRKPVYSDRLIPRGLVGRLGTILGCRALVLLHDEEGHPLLATTHRGDQHLMVGLPSIIARYEGNEGLMRVKRIIVDREGMGTEFLARLHADGRTVVTILRTNQYQDLTSFSEVGTFVPLSTDTRGQIVREVAPARISLPRPDHPGEQLCLQVALIRDLRRFIAVEPSVPDAKRAHNEPAWQQEGWQATAAPVAQVTPKLIPIVTTASTIDAVELAQTYIQRWPKQENIIKDYLRPLGMDTNHGFAKAPVENSEVTRRRAHLQQQLSRLKQWEISARKRRAAAEKRCERLQAQQQNRARELGRRLRLDQKGWQEQGMTDQLIGRSTCKRQILNHEEMVQFRPKQEQADEHASTETRKLERYCKGQQEVLRALEDLEAKEQTMYELDVRPVQLKLAREARGKLARERTLITDNPM